MFANYNYQYFPYVIVTFQEKITHEDDFEQFLLSWIQLYQRQQDFYFIFDTSRMGFINPKYCVMMSVFIKNLRQKPHQYLQKSYIIIKNKLIERLLDLIFYLQPPVAPVYLTSQDLPKVLQFVENSIEMIEFTRVIYPKKPILPFL